MERLDRGGLLHEGQAGFRPLVSIAEVHCSGKQLIASYTGKCTMTVGPLWQSRV